MKAKILKFLELNKWFYHASQIYILGELLRNTTIRVHGTGEWNKQYFGFLVRYPKAWCKFMWYSIND